MPLKPTSFRPEHLAACVRLIELSMNEDEARWSEATAQIHLACSDRGVSDGRQFWLYFEEEQLIGMVGLHHYVWGPPGNVWLSWFAVHPDAQGRGIGTELMRWVEGEARARGHRRLFVETYSTTTFERARRFYEARGFSRVGHISDYLKPGEDMVVFCKNL